MNLKKELGKKIQIIRKSKKMTQDQLAEIIKMDTKNVSRIENGNSYPTSENLMSIANALGVDVCDLFIFHEINYSDMKQEIINSLDNDKNILYLYKCLKTPT